MEACRNQRKRVEACRSRRKRVEACRSRRKRVEVVGSMGAVGRSWGRSAGRWGL